MLLYSNYRGILDGSTAGGYGSLAAPTLAAGAVTSNEGLIPGREYGHAAIAAGLKVSWTG